MTGGVGFCWTCAPPPRTSYLRGSNTVTDPPRPAPKGTAGTSLAGPCGFLNPFPGCGDTCSVREPGSASCPSGGRAELLPQPSRGASGIWPNVPKVGPAHYPPPVHPRPVPHLPAARDPPPPDTLAAPGLTKAMLGGKAKAWVTFGFGSLWLTKVVARTPAPLGQASQSGRPCSFLHVQMHNFPQSSSLGDVFKSALHRGCGSWRPSPYTHPALPAPHTHTPLFPQPSPKGTLDTQSSPPSQHPPVPPRHRTQGHDCTYVRLFACWWSPLLDPELHEGWGPLLVLTRDLVSTPGGTHMEAVKKCIGFFMIQ